MKVVRFHSCGGPGVLEVAAVEPREPGPGECQVRIEAIGVNPLDWKIRAGQLRFLLRVGLPYVPGTDFSGRVIALGRGVAGLSIGDPVIGTEHPRRGGAYAEVVTTRVSNLVRRPPGLSPAEAAGLPIAGLTALQGLRRHAEVEPGQRVLINGASGGVGHYAVQIARVAGCHVTAVCSARNHDLVRELGADETIDYHERDFTEAEVRWDVVFDAVSNRSFLACRSVLGERGVYLATLPTPLLFLQRVLLPLVSRRRAYPLMVEQSQEGLATLARMIEDGQLRTVVDRVLPLERAEEAQRRSEDGHVRGKLILDASDGRSASV